MAKDDPYWPELQSTYRQHIKIVHGGATRSESVFNGLASLDGLARNDDWVLVHDAARPCVLVDDVKRLIVNCLENRIGGILAKPVNETLKHARNSMSDVQIENTVNRDEYWLAATPQMFQFNVLKESLQNVQGTLLTITDEASAVEASGYPVQIVQCSNDNIKVTRQEDLPLISHILAKQGS